MNTSRLNQINAKIRTFIFLFPLPSSSSELSRKEVIIKELYALKNISIYAQNGEVEELGKYLNWNICIKIMMIFLLCMVSLRSLAIVFVSNNWANNFSLLSISVGSAHLHLKITSYEAKNLAINLHFIKKK